MQWYYAVNGQQKGPVEEEELFALGREGRIGPDDLVWNPTYGDQWVKASTVSGLVTAGADALTPAGGWIGSDAYVSQTHNRELMGQARERLRDIWGLAIGVIVVSSLINFACGSVPVLGPIASLLVSGPMSLGLAMFFLAVGRQGAPAFGLLFDGFRCLQWRFFGWWLLCLFTFGVGFLWLGPYIMTSNARFYDDLKAQS